MNLGIVGTGGIVVTCLDALHNVDTIFPCAICARPKSRQKASLLADKYNIKSIFTDYDAMLADNSIDFIYIGIINNMHYKYAKKALMAGKHIICEKPVTSHIDELNTLIAMAEKNNLFFFEAITLLYSPNYQFIRKHLPDLGPLKIIQANYFQYSSRYDNFLKGIVLPAFDPKLSGGCLYDLNIYNLHFVIGLLGMPLSATYYPNIASNGIDTSGTVILTYNDTIATCSAAKDSESISGVLIQGEKGYIHLNGPTNICRNTILKTNNNYEAFDGEQYDNRMTDEFIAFNQIYKDNDLSSCYKLLKHSQNVMRVLTNVRINAGIKFAADNHNL
ncbi:Gfo/Idh/MocA family protein [Pectinatus sottacetonis]|uniref:Gfo/Idh/MocA family protein n=1 Tax=Pectinatus sottacetonis TaxID=1002795 RepID=UPI0018C47F75|nr:Gfo/Idh/MocA family oxidoreductase [Pectinatus sottacetonis]